MALKLPGGKWGPYIIGGLIAGGLVWYFMTKPKGAKFNYGINEDFAINPRHIGGDFGVKAGLDFDNAAYEGTYDAYEGEAERITMS